MTEPIAFSKPAHYTAYMVRLWQDSPQKPWRASAQSAQTGEKVYFTGLEELFAFLQAQTEAGSSDIRFCF